MTNKYLNILLTLTLIFSVTTGLAFAQSGNQELEVPVVDVGYGWEWAAEIGEKFAEIHPDVDSVDAWGHPRMWEQIRPRIAAGDPPPVHAPGWGFDHWGAVFDGEVKSLNEALESEAYDKSVRWKDTFIPGIFETLSYEGEAYILPTFIDYYGLWYDAALWEEHGWEVPSTWDGLFEILDEMRDEGIAPIANQGQFPQYIDFTYLPVLIIQKAGPEAFEDIVSLEPGAWENPEVLDAVNFLKNELIDEYFQEGHVGMNHTQSQAEVMVGRAGLIANGSWMPNEMREVWPEENRLRCMPYPGFADSDYPQDLGQVSPTSSYFFLVTEGHEQAELGTSYLKFLTSQDMSRLMVEKTGAPMAIDGSDEWIPDDKIGQAVQSSADANLDKTVNFDPLGYHSWYPELTDFRRDQISHLKTGRIGPEEFVERLEEKSQEVREDPDTPVRDYEVTVE